MKITIDEALQQAMAAHKEGKLQDAERLYRTILQSQPMHPDANHNLGVLAVSGNKSDAALPLFKTALKANPKKEQFWFNYIDALIKNKKFEAAKQVIEQVKSKGMAANKLAAFESRLVATIEPSESYSAPHKEKPTFAEKRKKLAEAKKNKKKGKNPNSVTGPSDAELNKLLLVYQNKRFEEAAKLALSLTGRFPKHPFAWKILGPVLGAIGRKSEAVDANQTAVALSPQDAEAHSNLGITLKELGRLGEAEASYKHAIALKPDFAEAHSNLGTTLYELNRFDEAEASYKQAIVLRPDYVTTHSNLGNTLQELGRFDEAEASYKQAIALKPDFAEAHSHLGIALNAMGLKEVALKHFERNLQLTRGLNPVDLYHKSFRKFSNAKLDHDIEQFEYLAASGYDVKKFQDLSMIYRTVRSEINHPVDTDILSLSDKHRCLLGDTYNRTVHILAAPALDKSTMGDSLDVNKITENYFEHEFGLTYVDDFLSPVALKSLRDFLLGSTIWYDFFYQGGYIGAYLPEGLASPLVLQIAADLRRKFPKIFKHHQLTHLWAYKYDSRASGKNNSFRGINVHADFAAINVNFWITPNSANLDPSSGGLVVYNTEAPLEWNFNTYNTNEQKIREEILKSDQKKTIVPHNENRAVIFNSNLFHETDKIDFKEGYENRRINVTILFGKREL